MGPFRRSCFAEPWWRNTARKQILEQWCLRPPSKSLQIRILPFGCGRPRCFLSLAKLSLGFFFLSFPLQGLFSVTFRERGVSSSDGVLLGERGNPCRCPWRYSNGYPLTRRRPAWLPRG